ncbi:MAG: D-alanyl-D-alanine carboxypeptidase [Oscillospiraceae bacterium]|nr:D-alanyl-D-alanine carboxypeptidase [Oscillospiraceae bacterium]
MKCVRFMLVLFLTAQLCAPFYARAEDGIQVSAKSAVVMEAKTGRVLFGKEEHEQRPIASTTKILTALIALEEPDIDAVFRVNSEAIKVEGSSMGLQEGDMASLRALSAGMLLPSGNDGANAAAVRIAGSLPNFAARMNRRAQELGMINSSFVTPSGLDAEGHYSTAYDMALLTREAIRNPAFLNICSQYRMRASFGNPPYERWLRNHNRLLNMYEGTIGVKTGFTRKSGRCLVTAAERDGITLIVVTLNCPDDWDTHRRLYDRFFAEMTVEDVSLRIPDLQIPVTGGAESAVGAVKLDSVRIPVPAVNHDITYTVQAPPFLYAPVEAGQYVGEAAIYLEGGLVARLSLVAEKDVPLLHEYRERSGFIEWLTGHF